MNRMGLWSVMTAPLIIESSPNIDLLHTLEIEVDDGGHLAHRSCDDCAQTETVALHFPADKAGVDRGGDYAGGEGGAGVTRQDDMPAALATLHNANSDGFWHFAAIISTRNSPPHRSLVTSALWKRAGWLSLQPRFAMTTASLPAPAIASPALTGGKGRRAMTYSPTTNAIEALHHGPRRSKRGWRRASSLAGDGSHGPREPARCVAGCGRSWGSDPPPPRPGSKARTPGSPPAEAYSRRAR